MGLAAARCANVVAGGGTAMGSKPRLRSTHLRSARIPALPVPVATLILGVAGAFVCDTFHRHITEVAMSGCATDRFRQAWRGRDHAGIAAMDGRLAIQLGAAEDASARPLRSALARRD